MPTHQRTQNQGESATCVVRQKPPQDDACRANQLGSGRDDIAIHDGEVFRLEPDAKVSSSLAGLAVQLYQLISLIHGHTGSNSADGTYHIARNKSIPSPFRQDALERLEIYALGRCFSGFLDA